MPIDKAMTDELLADWLPPFLDAEGMNPSHPLREVAFDTAAMNVRASYYEAAAATAEGGSLADPYQDIADDVIEVLRGVARWITSTEP